MKISRFLGKPCCKAPALIAVALVALGGTVLLGWAFGLPLLARLVPSWPAMQPMTALTFVLAAIGLYSYSSRRRVTPLLLIPLAAIPVGVLAQYWTGHSVGMDTLLFRSSVSDIRDVPYPGRMAQATALEFLLFCLFLAWPRRTPRQYRWASRICSLGMVVPLLAIAGYLFGAASLVRASLVSMAFHTAAGMALLFAGSLLAQRDRNWLRRIVAPSPGARLARGLFYRLLGWLVALGILFPLLDSMLQEHRYLIIPIYAITLSAVFILVILRFAKRLDQWESRSRKATRLLESAQDRMAQVIDAMPGMIWTTTREGAVDFVSRQWLDYTGTVPETQMGAGFLESIHPDDREQVARRWTEAVAARTAFNAEYRLRRHDGAYRWFKSRGTPIFEPGGEISRWLGVVLDIEDLKRSQAALLDTQQRYQALFSNRTSAIAHHRVVTDEHGQPVDYIIEAINHTYERVLGCTRDEVEGKRVTEVFPGARQFPFDSIKELGRIGLEGGEGNFEIFFPPTRQWLSIYAYSPKRGEFTAIFTDISAQKASEAALRESERRLNLALSAGRSAVWELDVPSGRIVGADSLFTMYGYEPGEIGTIAEWAELAHAGDRPEVAEKIKDAIEGKTDGYSFEARLRCKDGTWRWNLSEALVAERDADGKALRIVGTHSNIDDRKHAEEALREERSRLQAIIDNSPLLILVKDMESRIVVANKAIFDNLRVPAREKLIGHTLFESFPQDVAESRWITDLATMDLDAPIKTEETLRHRDGTWHTYLTTRFPVHDIETRTLIGVCAISADISERKTAEARIREINEELEIRVLERTVELERSNEALLRSNMELQHFAHATAHDLKTPLRSIAGFTQLLQKEVRQEGNERLSNLSSLVVDNTRRLQTLIENLLAYTRLEAQGLPFTPANLREVAEEVVASLAVLIQETGAEVEVGDLPTLSVDRLQIAQVFQNLIENGIKYNDSRPPRIAIAAHCQEDEWVFSVTDNGIGIDPRHYERIFEIFRRLHAYHRVPGSGIGLALCRRVVERHGGHIWVESQIGQGSTFYFSLPVRNRGD